MLFLNNHYLNKLDLKQNQQHRIQDFYYIQFFTIIVPLSLESERIKVFLGKYYILFKAIFCFALCFLMNRLFWGHIKGELLSNYNFFWE